MNIAFEHQIFTSQSYGGISRYYTILADRLLGLSQNVSVLAGVHRNHYLYDLPRGCVHGVKLFPYPSKSGPIFHGLNHVLTQAQIAARRPNIIHETYYSSMPRIGSNSIRVTTAYDMIHELYTHNFPLSDRTTQKKRKTFERVDHIISISENTKKDLVNIFDIEESKISVVHLGVDVLKFDLSTTERSVQRPFLLFVGARGGYKNFTSVVRALGGSRLLREEFDLVAFGGGAFTAVELELLVHFKFGDSQVRQVSGDDNVLANLYNRALALVYPSIYEGFGMPPLEAMAAGCPVISSNSSSMPEVVNKAGLYFDPSDLDDMRNAIETVCFSSELRAKLIKAGNENARSFSWDKCAQKTLAIYEKLAGTI